MSTKLFDASDESDNDLSLGTNKDYAKTYNKFRQKELLKKFKDRGHDVSESDSSSDSETSDEAEVLDPKFDQEFFKTLASLKSKDPSIYDKNTKFFGSLEDEADDDDLGEEGVNKKKSSKNSVPKERKSKPVTLKDYERKIILEKGGKFEDDSDIEEVDEEERSGSPTLVEAERRLKAEFKQVVNADVDSEEEGFGGIFKKRVKTKEEADQEDADYVKWLAGKQENIQEEVKEKLEPLKKYWQNTKLPQSERFLRDYILNKGYAETNLNDIPTYDEIVGDTAPLSEDEAELEKQAEFEHKYNFRFEEPDAEFITRYPRTIEHSVRRTDDKRKQKRVEIKERKLQEKEQKMKELEMVREMKRKEIEEKIQKLKMVTGNEELGFRDEELDDDFDPDAHDRRMQEIFNEEYYQVNEGEEKPECPSDIEILKTEDWDNYDPRNGGTTADDYEPHCEDDDFNMDCDYDPATTKEQLQKELIENTKGRRNRKGRKNRFMELVQAEKPAFQPDDEKTYAEYLDEYYKMDCEDIIGDIPCRFKYVETTPNDFGLTIEEILLAKNKELNQWASLKKAIQIRPDQVEKKEQRLYKMKAKNEELKRKIFKSLYGEPSDEEADEMENTSNQQQTKTQNAEINNVTSATEKTSKKKRKRKLQATSATAVLNANEQLDQRASPSAAESNIELLEKKLKLDEISTPPMATTEAVISNIITTKKKKRKQKKKKQQNESTNLKDSETTTATPATIKSNKNSPTAQKSSHNPFTKTDKKIFKPNGNATLKSTIPPLRKKGVAVGSIGKHKTTYNKNSKQNSKDKTTYNKNSKQNGKSGKDGDSNISDERLKAYGINPKKFHKKKKYGAKK